MSQTLVSKSRVAMVVAEFLGAGLLTFTTLTIAKSDLPLAFFTAAAVGAALSLVIVAFGGVSGAHANPAVTIGFWSIRKVTTLRMLAYLAAQLAGAVLAFSLYTWITRTEDVAAFTWPSPGDNSAFWYVFAAEALGTFVFTTGIAAAVYKRYDGFRLAGVIGTALFAGILLASNVTRPEDKLERGQSAYYTGVVNPFVAIGTQSYGWEYVLGPVVGSLVGMNLYTYLFTDATIRRKSASAKVTTPIVTKVPVAGAPVKKSTAKKSTKKTTRKK